MILSCNCFVNRFVLDGLFEVRSSLIETQWLGGYESHLSFVFRHPMSQIQYEDDKLVEIHKWCESC